MLKACKHSDCAICSDIKEREVFKFIFQKLHPEVYICKNAAYKITNTDGNYFITPSLDVVVKGTKGYYIRDLYTTSYIELKKSNIEILCSCSTECEAQPYIAEYK